MLACILQNPTACRGTSWHLRHAAFYILIIGTYEISYYYVILLFLFFLNLVLVLVVLFPLSCLVLSLPSSPVTFTLLDLVLLSGGVKILILNSKKNEYFYSKCD